MQIAPDTRVTLHFALRLPGGEEIDSTFGKQPATFTVGDGNLLPGFEQALFGLSAGVKQTLEIPPEEAFGAGSADNVRFVPRSQFGDDMALEPGLVVSFRTPEGELPGVVRSIEGDLVVVDFNHPLAGRTIEFEVEILDVGPALGRPAQ